MRETLLKPEVKDFKRLRLRVHNHVCALSVTQGDEESIILRGPSQLLMRITPRVTGDRLDVELGGSLSDRIGDAFTTSLTRQRIEVDLKVRELCELDLGGFVEGKFPHLDVSDLNLAFSGLGKLNFSDISGRRLTATLNGSPSIRIRGCIEEQLVTVKGMGQYQAGDLQTQKTAIRLSGSAFATLWAEQELDIEMHGMGSIEYYGQPSIRRKTVGMNNLKALGLRSTTKYRPSVQSEDSPIA